MKKQSNTYEEFQISTYVINLPENTDRRISIEKQFCNKPEFLLHIVPAETHKIGAVGLWMSIKKIINYAMYQTTDDVIIICEDDHIFTQAYERKQFFGYVSKGAEYSTQIIFAGIGGVHNVVSVSDGLYWVDKVWCTQFIVIYRRAFQSILKASFTENDVADEFLCTILSNKLVIWPFLSIQQEFGYSDVTESNAHPGVLTQLFEDTNRKFERYNAIRNRVKGNYL